MLTAAVGAAAALTTAPAGARPDDDTPAGAVARVDRLYAQAERSTEKYNAAAERVDELREQISHAQDRAARGQAAVNRLRDEIGAVAVAQYRSGGIDPGLALLLTSEPGGYLAKAATLDRVSDRQAGRLREFQEAQRALEQYRSEAGRRVTELEEEREELKRHKKAVQRRLETAQRLLDGLSPAERAARASRSDGRSPVALPAGATSARAAAAVAAARRAVGSPYGWGQAGPGAFDCSGLTQWAYGQAGVALPRTSQGQRTAGRQVPMSEIRPGDLVTYRDDASHVAMYTGDGQVVHAPYPGAQVRYDPVGMMPVSAVTRP